MAVLDYMVLRTIGVYLCLSVDVVMALHDYYIDPDVGKYICIA